VTVYFILRSLHEYHYLPRSCLAWNCECLSSVHSRELETETNCSLSITTNDRYIIKMTWKTLQLVNKYKYVSTVSIVENANDITSLVSHFNYTSLLCQKIKENGILFFHTVSLSGRSRTPRYDHPISNIRWSLQPNSILR
jgi:hypothetical protein